MVTAQAIAPTQRVSEAETLMSETVSSANAAISSANAAISSVKASKAAPLHQNWDRLVDHNGMRDRYSHGLGNRDSNRLGNVHRDRHWIGDLNRDFNRIRYGFLDRVRYRLLYRDGVRFRDVNRVRSVYRDCHWNLHRDRNLLYNGHWIRLWHGNRDFLGNGDGLHVALAAVTEPSAVTQTVPGTQQADAVAAERVPTLVPQRISAPVAAQPMAVSQPVDPALLCLEGLFFFSKCNTAHRQQDEHLRTRRKHFVGQIERSDVGHRDIVTIIHIHGQFHTLFILSTGTRAKLITHLHSTPPYASMA
jgi:hypothetical protein